MTGIEKKLAKLATIFASVLVPSYRSEPACPKAAIQAAQGDSSSEGPYYFAQGQTRPGNNISACIPEAHCFGRVVALTTALPTHQGSPTFVWRPAP